MSIVNAAQMAHAQYMNTKSICPSLKDVFFSDADEYSSVDLNDGRLHELFNAETSAERNMKSAIFFGMPFKKIVKLYSIWKRYSLLMSSRTMLKAMKFDYDTLHSIDSYKDLHIMTMTIDCMQEYIAFEVNELDKTYLTDIEFADFNITPFNPVYPYSEFTIRIRSSEVKAEIFQAIIGKFRKQMSFKI